MDNDSILSLMFAVAMTLAVIGHLAYAEVLCKRKVAQWASDRQFKVMKIRGRAFMRGPHTLEVLGEKRVFYIEVQKGNDDVKRGFACCGGFVFGPYFSNAIEVRWLPK